MPPVEASHGLVWGMKISEVVQRKGSDVITIAPDATVAQLVALLHEHRIGAVVVSTDGGTTVSGIVSERDVVTALHQHGTDVLQVRVSSIMTGEVLTCELSDELEDLAVRMTERRSRHFPVVDEGRLLAIVSIGDVVKNRLDELQDERNALVHYVQGDRSTV